MQTQPIRFGDEGLAATKELSRRFEALAPLLDDIPMDGLREQLLALEALDRRHGGGAALPVDAGDELAAAAITALAHLELEAGRRGESAAQGEIVDLTLGVALWAMRHDIAVTVVEPVANALAVRSNRAASREELAAVFGLMQGLITHVTPGLAADLERSNPERPWRILHANFAITAIRTGDPVLMDYAFDALDDALPDERAGFYSEALALALGPRFPAEARERIEARHLKWTSHAKT